MIESSPPHESEPDPATQAFARLEGEMALVRRAVEHLATERAEIAVPDYSVTLGEMAQKLAVITAKPAMQLTPETLASRIEAAAKAARQADAEALGQALDGFERGSAAMRQIARTVQTVQEQRRRLVWAAGGGLLAGMLLWSFLPGTVARTMPDSWHIPEAIAAHIIGEPTLWEAGARLMQADSPQAWVALNQTVRMLRDNREAIEKCRGTAEETKMAARCVIEISPLS